MNDRNLFEASEESLTQVYLGRNIEYGPRDKNLLEFITSKVEGQTILDIGCADGAFASKLAKMGKHVIGIEPNGKLARIARKTCPGIKIIQCFGEEIDQHISTKVDTVTMIDVLEHVVDDELQIQKVHGSLKKNGQFVILVPAYPFLYGKRDCRIGHVRRYTKGRLFNLLITNGFIITYSRYWNMVGLLPYIYYEKILHKECNTGQWIAESGKNGVPRKMLARILDFWLRHIENNINLGFGFDLFVIAKKA